MRARSAVLAAMLAALTGCASSPTDPDDGVTKPPPPPPPPATLRTLAIVGQTTVRNVAEGSTIRFTASGTFSDQSVRDLTQQVSWSAKDTLVVFSGPGQAVAKYSGVTQITAKTGDISGSMPLDLRIQGDVPKSDFPQITDAEWDFISEVNLSHPEGRSMRVGEQIVRVWAQGEIILSEVLEGLRLLEPATGLRFLPAADSSSATWHYVLGYWPGVAGAYPFPVLNDQRAITSVKVVVDSLDLRGMSASENRVRIYAHEGAHAVGILGHYEGSCDILNTTTCNEFIVSPFISRVLGVLYAVPPGTRFY